MDERPIQTTKPQTKRPWPIYT